MSEQDDLPPNGLGRRESQAAWARVEAKLDVYIAGMSGWRDGVDRRLADHDAMHRQTTQTLNDIANRQAAQDAVDRLQTAAAPPKASNWSIASTVIAALAVGTAVIAIIAR